MSISNIGATPASHDYHFSNYVDADAHVDYDKNNNMIDSTISVKDINDPQKELGTIKYDFVHRTVTVTDAATKGYVEKDLVTGKWSVHGNIQTGDGTDLGDGIVHFKGDPLDQTTVCIGSNGSYDLTSGRSENTLITTEKGTLWFGSHSNGKETQPGEQRDFFASENNVGRGEMGPGISSDTQLGNWTPPQPEPKNPAWNILNFHPLGLFY